MRGSLVGRCTRSLSFSRHPQCLPRQSQNLLCRRHTSGNSDNIACKEQTQSQDDDDSHKVTSSIKSDAFLHMLASPLRRCTVTQTVLPKALMFQLTSHRGASQDKTQAELVSSEIEKIQKEPSSLLRRRSRRWIQREAKRSKHKSLLQSQRMLLHKIATSQTDKSREKFKGQLIDAKKQIASLLQAPPRGQLLPFGITRESSTASRDQSRGKGVWCTLSRKIVAEIPTRNTHRSLIATNPAPEDLATLVGEGLEERVLEEISLLQKNLTTTPTVETVESGWLIRRLRGPEVRSILSSGLIEFHYGGEIPSLACLIVSKGDIRLKDEDQQQVYRLDKMFLDESRKEKVKKAMRAIAIVLRKKAARRNRKADSRGKVESRDKTQDSPSDDTREMESLTVPSGQKYPRLHAIKRSEWTIDLCIALWRLRSWCER